MKTISTLRLTIASVLALGVVNANAAGIPSTVMNVTAAIVNSCVISAGSMDFGNYDPVDANKAADNISGAANITTACTLGSAPKVTLLLNGAEADNTDRILTSGVNVLSYGLYSDIARTTAWSATGVAVAATGGNVVTPVYGRIPKDQNMPLGTYTEAVTVEVVF